MISHTTLIIHDHESLFDIVSSVIQRQKVRILSFKKTLKLSHPICNAQLTAELRLTMKISDILHYECYGMHLIYLGLCVCLFYYG